MVNFLHDFFLFEKRLFGTGTVSVAQQTSSNLGKPEPRCRPPGWFCPGGCWRTLTFSAKIKGNFADRVFNCSAHTHRHTNTVIKPSEGLQLLGCRLPVVVEPNRRPKTQRSGSGGGRPTERAGVEAFPCSCPHRSSRGRPEMMKKITAHPGLSNGSGGKKMVHTTRGTTKKKGKRG